MCFLPLYVQLARSTGILAEAEEVERRAMETRLILEEDRQRLVAEAARLNKLSSEIAVRRADAVRYNT